MSIAIKTMPEIEIGTPKTIFAGPLLWSSASFDVTPDERRFVVCVETQAGAITVTTNWTSLLK